MSIKVDYNQIDHTNGTVLVTKRHGTGRHITRSYIPSQSMVPVCEVRKILM